MNQRVLTMICLKIIFILQYLVLWQKNYMRQKIKKENNELVELIKVRWSNLKDEIEKMSKKEIENEKPDKIFKIVKEILEFNKQKTIKARLKNINTKPNA